MTDTKTPPIIRLLRSPLTFLLFLIIPLAVVLLRSVGRNEHTLDLLLVNNALLLIYLLARLCLLARNWSNPIRYGTASFLPRRSVRSDLPAAELRLQMEREGYRFDEGGGYAEKRDPGHAGTLLAHGALVLLLVFGMYDNLRQLDGTILLGVGEPLALYEKESYGILVQGPLASTAEADMKLQVKRQMLPEQRWPAGATEVALLSRRDEELQHGVIAPGSPMRQGSFTLRMNRLVYDAWVVVTTSDNLLVFTNFVKLLPRADGKGGYSHYGEFADPSLQVTGTVWLDPQKREIKVETVRQGKKIVDTSLLLWGGNQKEQGGYVTKFQGLGQWSEIHVTRQRHKGMLALGGCLALAGLVWRLIYRPRRVWIESDGEETVVRSTSGKLLGEINSFSRSLDGRGSGGG